jgi:hypothetical protein
LSYLADPDEPALFAMRVAWLEPLNTNGGRAGENCCAFEHTIESEVFWRRGARAAPARERRRGRNGGER